MPKYSGPLHTVEFPLTVTESDRHRLERRFSAANTLYNGILQEGLRALDACRADPAWDVARTFKDKVRSEAFAAVREAHGLTLEYLSSFERQMRTACWIGDHLEARLGEVLVKRVLGTIERHLFEGAGRPGFRRLDDCRTIAASQDSPIRLRGTPTVGLVVLWGGLTLPVRREDFLPHELHSLECERSFCRIKRIPSGAIEPRSPWRYEVQVVVRGRPYVHRPRATSGTAGIDFGPGTAAVVYRNAQGDPAPEIVHLAEEVEPDEAEIRRSGRRLDRSLRAGNPDCYDKSGRCIRKPGKRTRGYEKRRAQQRRKEAKAASHRRNCHGRDTNRILAAASDIRIEDHGARGFASLWGKSLGRRAPGLFVCELTRKCLDTGGRVTLIDCRKAKLSQFDHVSQVCTKKPLSQRWHALGDGSGFVQRDLYSAFLAGHCSEEGIIDTLGAQAHWDSGVCERLVRPTATAAAGEAARARRLVPRVPRRNPVKDFRRWSGSDGSPAAPVMRTGAAGRGGDATARTDAMYSH